MNSLARDEIVTSVYAFYGAEKITSAKDFIYNCCRIHSPRRRSENRTKVEINDIIDIFEKIQKDGIIVAKFVASSFDSLPPLSKFSHLSRSIESLLDQIDRLHKEIDELKKLREIDERSLADFYDVKAEITDIKIKLMIVENLSSDSSSKLDSIKSSTKSYSEAVRSTSTHALGNAFSSVNSASNYSRLKPGPAGSTAPQRSTFHQQRRFQSVLGSGQAPNGGLQGIVRKYDIFVGGCSLNSDAAVIENHLKDICKINNFSCEQLPTKSIIHKAYKVTVSLAIRNKLLDPILWPEGIIVRKFYRPRGSSGVHNSSYISATNSLNQD